ncbi:MAG TPA: alpha/beta fold hydrolase [Burkholderiales bacterium]|nr:alpha/beta fold hydrolase [Burkholderiales bacterium]
MRDVILTHGLWVPGLVMQPLAARLARAGFRCRTFSYPGAGRPLEAHAERLARFARELGPAHFVGHSLGGLVILDALQREPGTQAGRIVLLGTPANGCYAGRRIARTRAGRWLLGESESLWREGRAARWGRPEALGVVAGTLPLGLGRLFGPLPGVNDGVVALEETTVEGMAERVALPVGHSAMLLSARVAEHVAAFLGKGRFPETSR